MQMPPLRLPAVRAAFTALLGFTLLASAGCISTKEKKNSGLMRSATDVQFAYSATQLRLLARDNVGAVCGRIEESADEILAGATDPAVRRAALVWKIEATSGYREALFRNDPIAAILDSLAFTLQMQQYFEEGPGRDQFGEWRLVAIETLEFLEEEHYEYLDGIVASGSPQRAINTMTNWAANNPIRTTIASRESILNAVGEIEKNAGTGGIVSKLGVTVDDMVRRLEVYSDQVPRQARWQAELLIMDELTKQGLDGVIADLPELVDTLYSLSSSLEEWEATVVRERETILAEVDVQRLETIEAAFAKVDELMRFVSSERATVIAEADRQRLATIADLQIELQKLVDLFQSERELLLVGERDPDQGDRRRRDGAGRRDRREGRAPGLADGHRVPDRRRPHRVPGDALRPPVLTRGRTEIRP